MYAVIGGSGLSKLPGFQMERRQVFRTPYGEPSGALMFGRLADEEVVFLARHGYGHTIAPHQINYRANMSALSQITNLDGVLSVASVGGIRPDLLPGQLMIPDQILDYTWGRPSTYFEGSAQVEHIDFTWPYDQTLRSGLLAAADAINESVVFGGCYACTQGPRLETAAEVRRLARDGADIVGMTGMPEAALARELNMPYAHLALVVNSAAGVGDSAQEISHAQISQVVAAGMSRVMDVVKSMIQLHKE